MKRIAMLLAFMTLCGILSAQSDTVVESTGLTIIGVLRGMLGMLVIIGIAWLISSNRKAVKWSMVAKGLDCSWSLPSVSFTFHLFRQCLNMWEEPSLKFSVLLRLVQNSSSVAWIPV